MASLLWLAGCDQVFSGHVVKQYCKEYCKYIYACVYIQCTHLLYICVNLFSLPEHWKRAST